MSTKTETLAETGTKIVEENFQCGEHLVVVWYDDNCLQWYLGVVDHIEQNNIFVWYMRSNKKGVKWLFPDKSDVRKTEPAQVLLHNIQVSYSLTSMIRCELSKMTFKKVQSR